MTAAVSGIQWVVGWAIAVAIVIVVVLVVGRVIYLASRIRVQLVAILEALTDTRDNTAALWEVQTTNGVAEDILAAARQARSALGGEEV
ncbi:MAG: hypothetical protein ABJC60_04165 [Actinomycetota bacterium]